MEEKYNDLKLAERGARISIIAYIALSLLKLSIGYIYNSEALMADGLNNTTDIIASLAVLIGLKISRKPADENHHYGHFRAETIASLIASFIMIAVGLDVLYNAVHSIIYFKSKAPDLIASIAAVVCALAIYMVYRYNKKIAIKINSAGLMAAAKDNLSDAWVSIGTAVGIVASQFGLPWIDPLAAVIVGILIIKTGWDIFREASHNLTDGFHKAELDRIAEIINTVPGVRKIKSLKARFHGNNILLDVVVSVSSKLNVIEGHDITMNIEEKLRSELNITEVVIHVEPDI
ncbi:transporter [Clostridium carboxidivorans P7]|uniref:Cation diffusion facilitator family transporter n=1 Tax=Clostridium carboxidivorans P7 TaxID=536227 RepID=C6PNW8_9CLOT|nr:cation diffusion facilitator family transporter [Clostridium carboxidivorans]AKN31275.1 transporter [Clostridium carboxidivorans P7]EET89046.1 cation diffusion facilitator family transporter [Clostridium carboxidivorans P7]EFG88402.1 cation diffusion facilitator family transporter [Clostridium carboxidivorans P7]